VSDKSPVRDDDGCCTYRTSSACVRASDFQPSTYRRILSTRLVLGNWENLAQKQLKFFRMYGARKSVPLVDPSSKEPSSTRQHERANAEERQADAEANQPLHFAAMSPLATVRSHARSRME
jgi:hypothetical protein